MIQGISRDTKLPLISKMLKFNLETFLFLAQILAFASAAGTKGSAGNQWNQTPQQRWPQTKGGPLGGWDDEVSNPRGVVPDEDPKWKLEDSIPGVPGQSYPNLDTIPETSFDCRKQMGPGYYGDMETQCQVFHICQTDGRQNSFLCPIGTIFNQQTFVCDWWFNVNCVDSSFHYGRNENLYKGPLIGIDGSKVSSYNNQQGQGTQKGSGQLPAVGIPSTGAGPRGGNWPSQQQDQSQGTWGTIGQGNQKGDARPMNQRRMGGGKNWPNRGPMNQALGNTGKAQKGTRRRQNQNVGWQQQGSLANQQGGRSKGSAGINNQGWNQRGSMSHVGNRGQMFNPQGGMKGGSRNQRIPNAQGGFGGVGGPMGRPGGRRMENGRGSSSKGFNTNTWSIRSQNFRVSSQDRKGSSSDIWPDNRNADVRSPVENYPKNQEQWQNQNVGFDNQNLNAGHSDHQNQNNEWNGDGGNFQGWNKNSVGEGGYEQNENFGGSFGSEQNWNSNVNVEKGSSWQVDRQWAKDQTENDYDYS